MAKRKDSVALFEVITATRRKEESAAAGARSALRTPKWWFKNKSKPADAPSTPSAPEEHEYILGGPQQGAAQIPPQLAAPFDPTSTATATLAASPTAAVVQRMAPVEYASPAPQRVNIPERGDGATGSADPFGLDVPGAQVGS